MLVLMLFDVFTWLFTGIVRFSTKLTLHMCILSIEIGRFGLSIAFGESRSLWVYTGVLGLLRAEVYVDRSKFNLFYRAK